MLALQAFWFRLQLLNLAAVAGKQPRSIYNECMRLYPNKSLFTKTSTWLGLANRLQFDDL